MTQAASTPTSFRPAQLPRQAWWFGGNPRRRRMVTKLVLLFLYFATITVGSILIGDTGLKTDMRAGLQPPTLAHLLGTDWLGRDMLTRTLHGLMLSLQVGLFATAVSSCLGTLLGLCAALGGRIVDRIVTWIIDFGMSLPHLMSMILVAVMVGGGVRGVILGVILTHWMHVARIMRAEVLQLKTTDYVQLSRKLGHSPWWIARHHLLPHLVPQFIVSLILLFPHAILHESALSFIGIGLSPHEPSIGIILAESVSHLITGKWWLAFLPGLFLLVTVKLFDLLGESIHDLLSPVPNQS